MRKAFKNLKSGLSTQPVSKIIKETIKFLKNCNSEKE